MSPINLVCYRETLACMSWHAERAELLRRSIRRMMVDDPRLCDFVDAAWAHDRQYAANQAQAIALASR